MCNDTKEDWWEKNKDIPIDLSQELNEEFKETNPSLNIHFLTLDKFFSYLAEELKMGKSKSALQLSALEDIKSILDNYEDEIYQSIGEYLITINVNEELLETGDLYLKMIMCHLMSCRLFSCMKNIKIIQID